MSLRLLSQDGQYDLLCGEVQECALCPRMSQSARILGRSAGPVPADLMFIAEAPGRLGADATGVPLHGDKTGHNFEDLLDYAGLSRSDAFITNCNPKDADGNNATPDASEIRNCSTFLRRQIELVNPAVIVTLGSTALAALEMIEPHGLQLRDAVRTKHPWMGRLLVPLYHPGQRAMIHRSFANQRLDYQFVRDTLAQVSKKPRKVYGVTRDDILLVAARLISERGPLSYFALHKLFYLVEYCFVRSHGRRLSGAYFIRQKDGPYCTDLQAAKLKKALPELVIRSYGPKLVLQLPKSAAPKLERPEIADTVAQVLERYRDSEDAALKTAVYLTGPMRAILRAERQAHRNFVNVPIDFLA
jgi:uracil-DNA glycosylase family 4